MSLIKDLKAELDRLEIGNRQIHQFGWIFFAVFTVLIPAWKYYRLAAGETFEFSISLVGLGALAISYAVPKMLFGVYRAWMFLGLVLGLIFGNLVVALVFYLVITPIGILKRVSGGGFMPTKPAKNVSTYWKERNTRFDKKDFERQF